MDGEENAQNYDLANLLAAYWTSTPYYRRGFNQGTMKLKPILVFPTLNVFFLAHLLLFFFLLLLLRLPRLLLQKLLSTLLGRGICRLLAREALWKAIGKRREESRDSLKIGGACARELRQARVSLVWPAHGKVHEPPRLAGLASPWSTERLLVV